MKKSIFKTFGFFVALLLFFCAMLFSPPPLKAQALIAYDTLKAGDSIFIQTVAPYGDDVTITIVDSNDSVTDSICVYEILPVHYDTVGAVILEEGAQFDSLKKTGSTIFTPGNNTAKTYRLINRQPWKLKIVRRNQHLNINHNTYIIIRARTRFLNAIPKIYGPNLALKTTGYKPPNIFDKYVKYHSKEVLE